MGPKDEEFLKRLRATFRIEAEEHLQIVSAGLDGLNHAPDSAQYQELIETAFRAAHSLKGAARSVNLPEIESICQSLESVFAALKKHALSVSKELLALLYQSAETLKQIISSENLAAPNSTSVLTRRLESAAQGKLTQNQPAPVPPPEALPVTGNISRGDTIRVAIAKLDALLLQAEEMLAIKLITGHRATQLRDLLNLSGQRDKDWAKIGPDIRQARKLLERSNGQSQVDLSAIDLKRVLEFLDRNQSFIRELKDHLSKITVESEQDYRAASGMIDSLLNDVKQAVMFPFSTAVEGLPNLVRSLSEAEGKEADLVIQGKHLEMDRRILESLKDPLIHIIRNSIDHGLERPGERARQQKPARGTINITVSQHSSTQLEILISDDGRGINTANVREAVVRLGLIRRAEAEQLNEAEILSFIFHSGLSTSQTITDLSGRGLGLAILQDRIEKLGGGVSVETEQGRGTTFRLLLPLTIATFRAVLVKAGGQLFAMPTNNVDRVVRIAASAIKTVENKETINLNERVLPLVHLSDILDLPRRDRGRDLSEQISAIVLSAAGHRIAFKVDEIMDEQEILVKNLGKQLARVRNIAGATILGAGQIVPILNVRDLLKSAVRPAASSARALKEKSEAKAKAILLAEDSITARALLRGILESAGYAVQTAVDGIDAFTKLKTETFDLLVSDVEMPRMSGFDLAARVRADRALSDLPIVLVTALASREDRERGVEVGANAYIVKSSFDQSNLLEVIARLI